MSNVNEPGKEGGEISPVIKTRKQLSAKLQRIADEFGLEDDYETELERREERARAVGMFVEAIWNFAEYKCCVCTVKFFKNQLRYFPRSKCYKYVDKWLADAKEYTDTALTWGSF